MSDIHKTVLTFKDLQLSMSEWCPFGQNAISTFNKSLDSLKGVKSSLLTGKVDEMPTASEFSIKPKFTRVQLVDFDRYNWVKFNSFIEYPEEVEQKEAVGTHVDKSGFINYALKMESVQDRTSKFTLDETAAILADLLEDTSVMMEALLTQFQRRILRVVYGETPFRPKFIIAQTSTLLPEHTSVIDYHDGEKQENEINQIVGIAYKFFDISTNTKAILGTNGMIFITDTPEQYGKILSFFSFVRSLQIFQSNFFARLRQIWDQIKDLRTAIFHLEKEESVGLMEQELSELGADIVLIEEVMNFMRSGVDDMDAIWNTHSTSLDDLNRTLAENLEISREIKVTREKIDDMEMVSKGLVDEIQGLRDMLNTLAEKRMREMSKLMTDNVQQGSDAQQVMAANVKASRYSGAALKILSTISAGYLGMRISDLIMKALDEINEEYWDKKEILGSDQFYGGYLQVLVGFSLWIAFTIIFWFLIKKSSDKMKEEKLAKDFILNLRIPIDIRSTSMKIQRYIDTKDIMFHNVEPTSQRTSWYHKEPIGEDKIFYTITMCYDLRLGHIHYMHVNTEDKKGTAYFTTDFLLRDLKNNGLITQQQEERIKEKMGFSVWGGD